MVSTTHCAVCGDRTADARVSIPTVWRDYLTDRDGPAEWGRAVPVCQSCAPRAETVRDQFFDRDYYPRSERREILRRAGEFLDDLADSAEVEPPAESAPTRERTSASNRP